MSSVSQELRRSRLDPVSYEILRRRYYVAISGAVNRVGRPGSESQTFRSHSGEDSEPNLITLCRRCHAAVHRGS